MEKPDPSCSVCSGPSFKQCGCPWHAPFDKWPTHRRRHLVDLVFGPARPGS